MSGSVAVQRSIYDIKLLPKRLFFSCLGRSSSAPANVDSAGVASIYSASALSPRKRRPVGVASIYSASALSPRKRSLRNRTPCVLDAISGLPASLHVLYLLDEFVVAAGVGFVDSFHGFLPFGSIIEFYYCHFFF